MEPKKKAPARIITSAWGERYINELLAVTLPAILAPGNLPALVAALECEFVLVTEQALFDKIQRSPVIARIRELCPVRLVPLDDLIYRPDMYGLALTYAHHRGFADLGDKMLDYYLFFFNSDFIIAEGSYVKVLERVDSGERLIVAPSYCVYDEIVRPMLLDRVDEDTGILAVQPRDLAEIGLRHRHHTIKGKTVNGSSIFHLEHIEQFYWAVDEHTLLAHQMPIAIVCMRPERVYVESVTLWDYGWVSEICPTTRHCVLGDTDDFCMIELRSFATAEVDMLAGPPTVEETARWLSTFYTKDHADFGRYPLVLHSRDLPPDFKQAQHDLQDYLDRVYALLSPPKDHLNHGYWRYHHPKFVRCRAEDYLKQQLLATAADRPSRHTLPIEFNAISIRYPDDPGAAVRRGYLSRLYDRWLGRLPRVTRRHGYWSLFHLVVSRLESDLKASRLQLTITSEHQIVSRMLEGAAGTLVSMPAEIAAGHQLSPVDATYRGTPTMSAPPVPSGAVGFDFCFCELFRADVERFRSLMTNVTSAMAPGGKIVVFYFDENTIDRRVISQLMTGLPSPGRSTVNFSGFAKGSLAHFAYRLFRRGVGRLERGSLLHRLAAAACIGLSMPLAYVANSRARGNADNRVPEQCISIMIEMTIG